MKKQVKLQDHLAWARSQKKEGWNKGIDYSAMGKKSAEIRKSNKIINNNKQNETTSTVQDKV